MKVGDRVRFRYLDQLKGSGIVKELPLVNSGTIKVQLVRDLKTRTGLIAHEKGEIIPIYRTELK